MKMVKPSQAHMEEHYKDLAGKGFFAGLIAYMTSGPVVAMVWEDDNVVLTGRKMFGATKPFYSAPDTIRGEYCIDDGRNIVHGSDSVESADAEIAHWLKPRRSPPGITTPTPTARSTSELTKLSSKNL